MKRSVFRAVIVFCLMMIFLSFSGCGSKESEEVQDEKETVTETKKQTKKQVVKEIQEEPAEAEEKYTFAERVCGRYSHETGENEYEILEITNFADNIYAYAGEAYSDDMADELDTYSFWAVEFIPFSKESVADYDSDECDFNILCFSIMSNLGKYWGAPQKVKLKITDDGLDWIAKDGTTTHYIRDERVASTFPYTSYEVEAPSFVSSEMRGIWKQIDSASVPYYVEFVEPSQMRIYRKDPASEVFLACGGLSLDTEKGEAVCTYSVLGCGDMPNSFAFSIESNGKVMEIKPDPDNECGIDIFDSEKSVMFYAYRPSYRGSSISKVDTITNDDIVKAGIDENFTSEVDYDMPDVNEGFYGVWISAFTDEEDADKLKSELDDKGFDAIVLLSSEWSEMNSKPFYCVSAGRCLDESEAEGLLANVKSEGYKDAYVKYTGNRLNNRVYYTCSSLDDVTVSDSKVVLNDLEISDPSLGIDYTMTLVIDDKTEFDKSCETEFFANYEENDTPLEWYKRNYDYSVNDPDKYMESGPALIGIFEVSVTDGHIDRFLGSYWWD